MDWLMCAKTFNTVVEVDGFAKAARQLYTTASAVSKRVAWLEEMLGVQLLSRTTRHLQLTDAGQRFHERTQPLLEEWDAIKSEVSDMITQPQGVLTVGLRTSGNAFAYAKMNEFLARYPLVSIQLKQMNHRVDLFGEGIDVFICPDNVLHNLDALETITLLPYQQALFASPDYLAKHSEPKSLAELERHNCLTLASTEDANTWSFDGESVAVSGNFCSDEADALIKAAVDGLGVVRTSTVMIPELLQTGKLVPVLPQYQTEPKQLCVYYPRQRYVPLKTTAFLEYLQEIVAAM